MHNLKDRWDGFDVVEMSDELRWISLVSSGDPIIHMWISVTHLLYSTLSPFRYFNTP